MKMKNDVAVIIILLVICFVVIPILTRLFVQEGYYNMDNIQVNRVLKEIKSPQDDTIMKFDAAAITTMPELVKFDLVSNYFSTNKEDRPGQDISYNYCLGKLSCDSGYEMKKLSFKDNDNSNLYYPYCVSGSSLKELRCEGGLRNITKEGDAFDSSGYTPLFSYNRYKISDTNPFFFNQYELNASKTGTKFVKEIRECEYIESNPLRIACTNEEARSRDGSSNALGGGEINQEFLSTMFKAFMSAANASVSNSTSSSTSNSITTGSGEPIKCIADFGTKIGDNLCCGQTGVLQDTRYTCPNTLPYCGDFKCGSKFGTCRK